MTGSRTFEITTDDQALLEATGFDPETPPKAIIILNGATGVRRGFYARFGAYAAERGIAVITYDYRGIGGSLREPIGRCSARMRDWGEHDFPSVIAWTRRTYPGVPLFALGHSVGGQLFGLTAQAASLDGLIGIGAQSGYWRLFPSPVRMWFIWTVLAPMLSRVFGYLPGWTGVGESLPGQVALEWALWCRSEGFFVESDGRPMATYFATISAPVLWIGIEDDSLAPPAAVDWLARRFTSARMERCVLAPRHYGEKRMGHFRFFTPRFGAAWDVVPDWVNKVLAEPAHTLAS